MQQTMLNTAPVLPAVTSSPNEYLSILDAAWQQHLAPRTENAPTVISTFAGAGGSSLGYSMAGYRELLAVEWDDNAVATFRLNFPDVPIYHGDIARLTVDDVFRLTGLKPGALDVFDGSPPCQGFSTAGKRLLDDPRNQLFRLHVLSFAETGRQAHAGHALQDVRADVFRDCPHEQRRDGIADAFPCRLVPADELESLRE